MRRLLLSLGLAIVVGGAVLGAAATLTISPATLGAGTEAVGSCDPDGVTVQFEPTYAFQMGVVVNAVQFRGVADACAGRSYQAVVTQDGVNIGLGGAYQWMGGSGANDNILRVVFWPPNPGFAMAPDVNGVHLVIR